MKPMFERPHHRRIAEVLTSLDASVLAAHHCLFGGGTAMALKFGEYRESVDIDFLVSDVTGYRHLRQLLTNAEGIAGLVRADVAPLVQRGDSRADQYGIRLRLLVDGEEIKLEIVLEGRIALEAPEAGDAICGVPTLTPLDMATSKLLANADRWGDDGVFARDLIDLAMMRPALPLLTLAVTKAERAYGPSIRMDLGKAIERARTRHNWLERCMQAMAMAMPKALLWQRIRALQRVLR
jgi:hypothetical protein